MTTSGGAGAGSGACFSRMNVCVTTRCSSVAGAGAGAGAGSDESFEPAWVGDRSDFALEPNVMPCVGSETSALL